MLPAKSSPIPAGRIKPLPKAPTGIAGLDAITGGGLPLGRATLVCGGAGCGKTLLGLEFLLRGALEQGDPGLFVAFEESELELMQNAASLGFDLRDLIQRQLILVEYIHVEPSEIEETGEYDLEGLFIRLGAAIDSIGARRVVLDTLEVLFSGFSNAAVLRGELGRLFRWFKKRGVTVILTAERGEGTFTRHGLEEYVSDCVILLDHRVVEQVSTRRIRVVKYRGSAHGTNEYPFLIDEHGLTVLPITSLGLRHPVSTERISSGVPALDTMLAGRGYYRGSSILVSGTAGSGKSSMAAHFAQATVERGERCLYIAFEEAPSQIMRNMRSIGLNLERGVRQGRLLFHAVRPTHAGLETHLAVLQRVIEGFKPQAVVIDPITNLINVGTGTEVRSMLTRLIDYLKAGQITALFTSLTADSHHLDQTEVGVSSLVDAWLVLRDVEANGERNRVLYLLKARGLAHSNQMREFRLTRHGIELTEVYVGPGGVFTGTARTAQEAQDRAAGLRQALDAQRLRRTAERKRRALEAQIAALQAELEAEAAEAEQQASEASQRSELTAVDRRAMARLRSAGGETRPPARRVRRGENGRSK